MGGLQTVLSGGLILLLIFAPAAFGSVEPWSSAVLVTGVALLALPAIGWRGPAAGPALLTGRVEGLQWPFLALAAIALLQLLPLGPWPVALLSPAAASIQKTAGLGGMEVGLSLHRGATLRSFSLFMGYGAAFLLTLRVVRDRRAIRRFSFFVLLFAFALAVEGILQHLTASPKTIYWIYEIRFWQGHPPFGPYVGRNHYGGLMALLVPFGAGYVLSLGHRRDSGERPSLPFRFLGLVMILTAAAALLLSASRGAILSAAVVLGAMTLYLRRRRVLARGGVAAGAVVAVAVAVSMLWAGGGRLQQHFMNLPGQILAMGSHFRGLVWKKTLGIAADFPLTGSGFGTFGRVFRHYQDFNLETGFTHAHNDYLQLLAEGGVFALIAALAGLVIYYRRALTALARRRDGEAIVLGAGALAGVTAFLLHAFIDFNFRIPANAFWFSVMAALTLNILYSKT